MSCIHVNTMTCDTFDVNILLSSYAFNYLMTIDKCALVAFVSIDFTINDLSSLLLDDRLID